MQRLYVPFSLLNAHFTSNQELSIDIWSAVRCRVYLVENLLLPVLSDLSKYSADGDFSETLRHLNAVVGGHKLLLPGQHLITFPLTLQLTKDTTPTSSVGVLIVPCSVVNICDFQTNSYTPQQSVNKNQDLDSGSIPITCSKTQGGMGPIWGFTEGVEFISLHTDIENRVSNASSSSEHGNNLTNRCLDFGIFAASDLKGSQGESSDQNNVQLDAVYLGSEGLVFSPQEMFGFASPENAGAKHMNDELDCVVCLTEQKEVLLLPCRHFCVCHECFIHIDKCPVCRSAFDQYVTVETENEILSLPRCPVSKR